MRYFFILAIALAGCSRTPSGPEESGSVTNAPLQQSFPWDVTFHYSETFPLGGAPPITTDLHIGTNGEYQWSYSSERSPRQGASLSEGEGILTDRQALLIRDAITKANLFHMKSDSIRTFGGGEESGWRGHVILADGQDRKKVDFATGGPVEHLEVSNLVLCLKNLVNTERMKILQQPAAQLQSEGAPSD